MRLLRELEPFRQWRLELEHYGATGDDFGGVFTVPSPIDRKPLRIVASAGDGWDHVSVSRHKRTPNWHEMDYVKRLFFKEDETAMQLHVPATEHVNNHPHCLHLWRPLDTEISRPPARFVGVAGLTPEEAKTLAETYGGFIPAIDAVSTK